MVFNHWLGRDGIVGRKVRLLRGHPDVTAQVGTVEAVNLDGSIEVFYRSENFRIIVDSPYQLEVLE